MSGVIVKGALPIGVEIDGQRHREFEIRPATVADSVAAIEEYGPDAGQVKLRYSIMARRIRFPGIDPEKVTLDLVMSLCDRDGVAIEAAAEEVEKKLDELSSS